MTTKTDQFALRTAGMCILRRECLTLITIVVLFIGQTTSPPCCHSDEPKQAMGFKKTVKAMRAAPEPAVRALHGMGTLKCRRELKLGFDEKGVVSEVLVNPGDMVQQGQILARLESSVLASQLAVEEAKLAVAEAEARYYEKELEKREALINKEAISDTELQRAVVEMEKAKANVKLTEAEIETMRKRLQRRILRAPTPGLVSECNLDVGSVVAYSTKEGITLIECDTVYAEIELGEKLFAQLRPNLVAKIVVDALGGEVFRGSLASVSPAIDETNRTFIARIAVNNPRWVLRSGMFVRAEIAIPEPNKPIWIPTSALIYSEGESGSLFVVKDGFALKRSVRLGKIAPDERRVMVEGGLAADDIIIVEGQDSISDLQQVTVEMVETLPVH